MIYLKEDGCTIEQDMNRQKEHRRGKFQHIYYALRKGRRVVLWAGVLCVGLLVLLVLAVCLWPMNPEMHLRVHRAGEAFDRNGRLIGVALSREEQWCFERSLDEISPWMVRATLAAEDARFYTHHGVDPYAFLRAMGQNIHAMRVVSGASTLTMQIVKSDPSSSRTIWGKLCQIRDALLLERHCNKEDILTAYLNRAPYGMNLVGCEAAARRYFGKPARELTLAEAALLAGLPKAPTSLMPLRHPERAKNRRDYVLRRMYEIGYIKQDEYKQAKAEPVQATWHDFPEFARHTVMRHRTQMNDGGHLHTTLDMDIQRRVEDLVEKAIRYYAGSITNAAVIVVSNDTAEVLARVGSVDFYGIHSGQFDASRAARSPGSTLKPFIYAQAMENNQLLAGEMLYDGALDYGRYLPENFDLRHRGLVSSTYALRASLNVPAVTVLERITAENFVRFMRQLGLTTATRPADHYGLGLTLGNCEARLDELIAAYSMVARLGEYRPLRETTKDTLSPPHRILSQGTCLMLYNMLEQALPHELDPLYLGVVTNAPRIAWKTGTSTGFRDAWTFIFNRQYTVGVWLGNNSGISSPHLIGAHSALPLAGRIFRSLPVRSEPSWPAVGDTLREVVVCAVSGLPATEWCRNTRVDMIPRDRLLHRRCSVHHPASRDLTARVASIPVREWWPGKTRGWDLAAIRPPAEAMGISTQSPDSTQPNPETIPRSQALRILLPTNRAQYVLTGEDRGDRIRLTTSVDTKNHLHWYMNDRYLGRSAPDIPLYLDLKEGSHRLTCMANDGSRDTIEFVVLEPQSDTRFGRN